MDDSSKNLVIGGILQNGPDPDQNKELEIFADHNQALYIPTYYTGDWAIDSTYVEDAINENPQYENGLMSDALHEAKYNTIIGYSGGTATAVAALDGQHVTCNTLILISPMKGTLSDSEYQQMIQRISEKVKNIVVLWSPNDQPTKPMDFYQAKPSLFANMPKTSVYEVPLTKTGIDGHIEILLLIMR